jgi:hypothetical protein
MTDDDDQGITHSDLTADGLHAVAAAVNRVANELGAIAYAISDVIARRDRIG